MFNPKNIIEFINKIINQVDNETNEEIEENLRKFRDYLDLTQMCDSETLEKVDRVLECYDSLMNIKHSFGFVDVSSLFAKEKEEAKKLVKKRQTKPVVQQQKADYTEKHYRHYTSSYREPVISSSCGGSDSLPTWSSGCGGGSSYRSGC